MTRARHRVRAEMRPGNRRERALKDPDPELAAALWRESVRLTGVDLPS